jgi:hypothetical protein
MATFDSINSATWAFLNDADLVGSDVSRSATFTSKSGVQSAATQVLFFGPGSVLIENEDGETSQEQRVTIEAAVSVVGADTIGGHFTVGGSDYDVISETSRDGLTVVCDCARRSRHDAGTRET